MDEYIGDKIAFVADMIAKGLVARSEKDYMNANGKIMLFYNSPTIPDNPEIDIIFIFNTKLKSIPDFKNLSSFFIIGSNLNCLPEHMSSKFLLGSGQNYPKWLPYDKLLDIYNF